MTADIRMALENELDDLVEGRIDSWIQRCFDSCDPRYDSDWLNGMLELAVMQFPENYEVRAAASRAATMEAQRLYDEGDSQEAVSRLERLLESDPYCTEAFELLEKFMQAAPVSAEQDPPQVEAPQVAAPQVVAPQVVAPEPEPVVVVAPVPVPVAEVPASSAAPVGMVVSDDDDLLSFLAEDVLIDLDVALPEAELSTPLPAAPVAPPPEPAPIVAEVAVEPPPAPAIAAPPPAAPVMATAAAGFDWRSVIALPSHGSSVVEPQLEALLPSLTERFSQVRNYRGLVLLLTDLYQRDASHLGVSTTLNSVLRDWALHLEHEGRGPEGGQVAVWSQQLLGSRADWATAIAQKYPSQPPNLPDLGGLSGLSAPNWMSWVNVLRDDPNRFREAAVALSADSQGLQSLFRHLAVHHPNHPDHVLNLGWGYSQTGQPALAMVHTQRAIQLRPSARAYQLLQQVYLDLGQPEMAQRVSQQMVQLQA